MPRKSKRNDNIRQEEEEGNRVASHVRDRQRAVAEREAARLARPEKRSRSALAHANRKLSAVSSTPFGFLAVSSKNSTEQEPEEWCGPFSVARQMIAQREEAKRKREEELEGGQEEHHPLDAIMDEVHMQQQRKIHPSMQWKSNLPQTKDSSGAVITSTYAKRKRRMDLSRSQSSRIPSLFQLTVNFIVDHFEHVESLGVIENDVRVAIANELVTRSRLDDKALEALIEPQTMETLEISDCSGIAQEALASVLGSIGGLRYVLLTHAGRCFGPKAVKALLEDNESAKLCCLSVDGAYLLKDEDVAKLIRAHASTLRSLAFQSCPLFGNQFVDALHNNPRLNLLELSLQQMTFSTEQLQTLSQSKDSLQGLQSLTLRSVSGLTDAVLSQFLETAQESLERLDIGLNHALGDTTLSSIRKYCSLRLKTLILDGIKGMTGAGLEALFTHPLGGLPAPPKLKVLNMASMDHEAVTEELLKLVTANYSNTAFPDENTATEEGVLSYASYRNRGGHRSTGGGLAQLDVQGSTVVTDHLLEQLVETSANTLESLNVSYCPLIQDQGLGYLVSKAGPQLTRIEVWGCAQLTDEFFDGHDRVRDGTLEIIGAWMKKSGTRSLR